ncbi:hypothetical protein ES332_A11G149900v1 [Gossypium tomentosum]|uniref:Uncharacterized protein n=1 Tax=Gossypium tomentosum TaxID=34277 RepID=A0A5D2N9K5_GOSTO|nr:hypothetical protein ES332_A11G149900v1 [Gossypium tomentosum]TYI00666.1 hypothetical protein ES332_A11G149900v1 [Gossypium tomentosum]TYI00667.1 hypothetical protein ES332_A11G149900v1 [Gossypium tomentosum]TYI00668.1 hypothetical protein ES332_A11G149900v1 [Gossypium tomentosum]
MKTSKRRLQFFFLFLIFLRYCPKVFQSRRFWFSYRLDVEEDEVASDVPPLLLMLRLAFSKLKLSISGNESMGMEREHSF